MGIKFLVSLRVDMDCKSHMIYLHMCCTCVNKFIFRNKIHIFCYLFFPECYLI